MILKFGVTMRITEATGYKEYRDSIAMDWSNYFLSEFPDSTWVFLPNIREKSVDYFNNLGLNVLVLSGGDNIGIYPQRDATELALLHFALQKNIPVIAVCRGMQLVHVHFGGKMKTGDKHFKKLHRATSHEILLKDKVVEVNSYHENKIVENSLHASFNILAKSKQDNSIEAFENKSVLAMMWHPERDYNIPLWNKNLILNFLKNYEI
jgi:N5-(cytidine 5'-diphosphoramidyl)-L-glutamine hydrolase